MSFRLKPRTSFSETLASQNSCWAIIFQFPLWDTHTYLPHQKAQPFYFQFPLWDTTNTANANVDTYTLSIPFMGYTVILFIYYLPNSFDFQFPLWDTYQNLKQES